MTNDHFAGDDRSHWQRMLDGDPYIADGPEFAEASRRATRHHYKFLTNNPPLGAFPISHRCTRDGHATRPYTAHHRPRARSRTH